MSFWGAHGIPLDSNGKKELPLPQLTRAAASLKLKNVFIYAPKENDLNPKC